MSKKPKAQFSLKLTWLHQGGRNGFFFPKYGHPYRNHQMYKSPVTLMSNQCIFHMDRKRTIARFYHHSILLNCAKTNLNEYSQKAKHCQKKKSFSTNLVCWDDCGSLCRELRFFSLSSWSGGKMKSVFDAVLLCPGPPLWKEISSL